MKRALLGLLLAFGCLLTLSACLSAPVMPPMGIAYTDYKAPLDIDYEATPVTAKKGEAMSQSYVGLIALGDASAEAAARAGGIKKIESADYHYRNVLGVYQEYTTIVTGE